MVRINWARLAKDDLKNIADFISKDSKFYAERHIDKIRTRTQVLKKYPQAGKVVSEFWKENIRELVLGNYRIIYEIISDSQISILTILHSAREMENQQLLNEVRAKAQEWLSPTYDEQTRKEVQQLLDNDDSTELIDSFYRSLEFGTGGLRGIMGAGTNRMNIYTVGAATQGLSNYLKKNFADLPQISVAIGHDCRNNSRLFSESSAKIFAANGIKAYLFEDLRPTPELSYAIRELGCQSGIILTASHNPKEYNGYKAYWDDGSQIVAPHDENIVAEVAKIKPEDIKFDGSDNLIEILGEEMDKKFLAEVKKVSISPEVIARHHDIKR